MHLVYVCIDRNIYHNATQSAIRSCTKAAIRSLLLPKVTKERD